MASVTYISKDDQIYKDFTALMQSLTILPPPPLTENEAIDIVKKAYPAVKEYPGESLPPTSIYSIRDTNGWHVSFQTEGSGVPYVLAAICFNVDDQKTVSKIGEYKHEPNSIGIERIDPKTCKAFVQ